MFYRKPKQQRLREALRSFGLNAKDRHELRELVKKISFYARLKRIQILRGAEDDRIEQTDLVLKVSIIRYLSKVNGKIQISKN